MLKRVRAYLASQMKRSALLAQMVARNLLVQSELRSALRAQTVARLAHTGALILSI